MEWYKIFIFLAIQIRISTATDILYVLPDNSTDAASCPSQLCATLSQYLLDNGTLPVVSNVEYYFLPGEHHVPTNMILENLHNFSIIGIFQNKTTPAVLIGYVIEILRSYNVTIANVTFKHSYQEQCMINLYESFAGLKINWCHNCKIQNAVFINFGLTGTNLIGYLTKIVIRMDRNKLLYHPGISLAYTEQQSVNDFLIMSHIDISDQGDICYSNCNGIRILVGEMNNLRVIINNSRFYNLARTAINIRSQCSGNNTIVIENCVFSKSIVIKTKSLLIDVLISHNDKSVIFRNCKFSNNILYTYLLSTVIRPTKECSTIDLLNYCTGVLTNISFVGNQFHYNTGGLIMITGQSCKVNILVAGPTSFVSGSTRTYSHAKLDLIHIVSAAVSVVGPVTLSMNAAYNIMLFQYCDLSFSKNITFKSNRCAQVIDLLLTYIKIMEYANILLIDNKYDKELIKSENINDYKLYPWCIFQFITFRNTTTVSPMHYSINIIDNFYSHRVFSDRRAHKNCLIFQFYYFTPHCQWISTGVFYDYTPKEIYQKIVKINNPQSFTYH